MKAETTIITARAVCMSCSFSTGGRDDVADRAVAHHNETGHAVQISTHTVTKVSRDRAATEC